MSDEDVVVPDLEQYFWNSVDLLSVFRRGGKIGVTNPAWATVLGWDPENLKGQVFTDLLHPDDLARTSEESDIIWNGAEATRVGFQNRLRRRDGSYCWIEWTSRREGDLIYSTGRDVTVRNENLARLDASIEMTSAIFSAAADLIVIVDRNLKIADSSPSGQNFFGYPDERTTGADVVTLVHPDDRPAVEAALTKVFESGQGDIVVVQYRGLHADGHWMTIEARGQALHSNDGVPTHAVFISRDITDAVAFESTLERAFNKTKAILDAAPDSIIVINRDLMVMEASPGTEIIYGFPRSERMGHSSMTIVHPDDQEFVRKELERLFDRDSDELVTYRFRARHADGRWLIIETRGRVLRDHESDEPRAVLVSRDISKAVAAEEALEVAKEEAERANAAKSEFMSRMSHELRTPLNSVLGFAQILQMELQSSDDLELVDHVYKSGQHLLTLINEVLDISRVESGTIGLSLEPVNLHDLVSECLDIIGPQANERDVGIRYSDTFDYLVRADHLRLKQVVLNLFSNAIKYNRRHGNVTLHCTINLGLVRFAVSDTGHGIAPELRERLFTAFDRLDAESRGIEGTGLGLTLSKTLIEAMGGTLGFESVVDIGSTFWFELPLFSAPFETVASMAPKG